ncbi:uncharacterized protein LOC130369632 isoform X1 [Hyla sarda]|uniref:uncharacterized protein LOC130369632 isoform X1 n=1 Tax=Hyla sarda TaxID=327740 RepID=UPI0024C3DE22|nr:uncharacterized protein LOC130369632 isoform X1 [Hyla sarda]
MQTEGKKSCDILSTTDSELWTTVKENPLNYRTSCPTNRMNAKTIKEMPAFFFIYQSVDLMVLTMAIYVNFVMLREAILSCGLYRKKHV